MLMAAKACPMGVAVLLEAKACPKVRDNDKGVAKLYKIKWNFII